MDIACFQETKSKGSRTREGNNYKLWYSGSTTTRNGVGFILASYLKDKVVQVSRISDKIMMVRLLTEEETDSLDDLVRECSTTQQQLIIAGDLNGLIGAEAHRFLTMSKGFGYGVRNEEGRMIIKFVAAHDLVFVNSFFKRRPRSTEMVVKPRILWKNLYGEAVEAFRDRVTKRVTPEVEGRIVAGAEQMWNGLESTIREAAK
ncbi:retrovirus-related pol polyprotein LINE-1 [Tanacetum coccineum]